MGRLLDPGRTVPNIHSRHRVQLFPHQARPAVVTWGILALLSLFLFSGCAALVDRFSGRQESCRIIAYGQSARAMILKLIDTGITINQDPVVEFVLEVRPGDGKPFEARTKALVSRLEVPLAQPGRIVPVKFDPRMRNRVAIDLWDCDR